MDIKEAKLEAKKAGLFFAIEALTNRLENDITEPQERKGYAAEIARLTKALQATYSKGN
jgi:hypothetical protein